MNLFSVSDNKIERSNSRFCVLLPQLLAQVCAQLYGSAQYPRTLTFSEEMPTLCGDGVCIKTTDPKDRLPSN